MRNREETVEGVPARVLIADDHPILRDALRRFLKRRGHEVVAEAGDGETAVRLALAVHPDVALLDIVMPGAIGGLGAARRISRACTGTHVVMISGFMDAEHPQRERALREPVLKPKPTYVHCQIAVRVVDRGARGRGGRYIRDGFPSAARHDRMLHASYNDRST